MSYVHYNTDNPISSHIDRFIQSKKHLRPMSIQTYHAALKRFYKITQDDLVSEDSLKIFLKQIKDRKVSQKYYNNLLTVIKIYVNWLKKRGFVTDISFLSDYQGYKNPEKVRQKKYYPEEQVQEFLQVKPRWFHYFLFLAFYFGFRPNELSRLETVDINLTEQYIKVRPSVQKIQKLDFLAIPDLFKNKFHELLSWRDRQESSSPRLLVNRFGSSISRDSLNRHLPKLRAIDSDFKFYDCRYTTAWRAYKLTNDIYLVQQLLRHSSPRMTVDYLGIQRDEVLATQRKQLDKVFSEVQL